MALRLLGHIDLPPNQAKGGFDHADIHLPTGRLYVAHTANDAVDVIDTNRDEYIASIHGLTGVAGVLVSEERGLVFTSNRGENTVSVFAPGREDRAFKVQVGERPNGLAFDHVRGTLIAANVGDPSIPGSYTVSVVDVGRRERTAENSVPGRTRWAVYDAARETFFVNMASPGRIIAIHASNPTGFKREYAVAAEGPHGLEYDVATNLLLCACDAGVLIAIDATSGRVVADVPLSGGPDVVFLNSQLGRLYVAIRDPGVVDVVDARTMRRHEVIATEAGAHTLAIDRRRKKLYALLPNSHRAAVFEGSA
jgi:DNA-binding beta-propeller fold protein YncE